MELHLYRTRVHRDTTDGHLYINGQYICDTAERTAVSLPYGDYLVTIAQSAPFGRLMPLIRPLTSTLDAPSAPRHRGRRPRMPAPPQFIFGNGTYTLPRGDIIVGEHCCRGLVIHSKETFDHLFERLRKHTPCPDPIVLYIRR